MLGDSVARQGLAEVGLRPGAIRKSKENRGICPAMRAAYFSYLVHGLDGFEILRNKPGDCARSSATRQVGAVPSAHPEKAHLFGHLSGEATAARAA
jgi:hypothetical protein